MSSDSFKNDVTSQNMINNLALNNLQWLICHKIQPLKPGLNGWGCRIYRLHLCRVLRPPPMSGLNMTLNNVMVRFQ